MDNKTGILSGVELIFLERQEQLNKHGRTVEDDVFYNNDMQLSVAAMRMIGDRNDSLPPRGWDEQIWQKMISKPKKDRLIIAGALIAAEIDRLNNL